MRELQLALAAAAGAPANAQVRARGAPAAQAQAALGEQGEHAAPICCAPAASCDCVRCTLAWSVLCRAGKHQTSPLLYTFYFISHKSHKELMITNNFL